MENSQGSFKSRVYTLHLCNEVTFEQFSAIIKQLGFQNVRAGVAVKVNISQEHP